MVQKPPIAFQGKVEIIGKNPYPGSGPRGIDVYTRRICEHLSKALPHASLIVSREESSRRNVDLIHYTFFDPFFLTLWGHTPKHIPYILTIHDLIPIRFPEHFPSGLRGKLKYFLQKQAAKRAAAIITDSLASQRDIAKFLGYPLERIHVVPLAAGSVTATSALTKTVTKQYHLPPKYLLYVGDINWNKNVPGLIHAFSSLADTETALVLVGKAFVGHTPTPELTAINAAIAASPKKAQILKLGFVPTHHLSAIYRGATLYVQPSWYEGFGFPVIEALSQGTPVLSSNKGSLPEVGGEHVHYFDPASPTALATSLTSLLANPTLRTQYHDSALVWSKQFTWKHVAQATLRIYEKYAH